MWTASPSRFLLFLVFILVSCSADRPWLNRSEVVRTFPPGIQKEAFIRTLQSFYVYMSGDVPDSVTDNLPDMVEYLVNGQIDRYLLTHPSVASILDPIVHGGVDRLKRNFGGKNVYIANASPFVICPANINTHQDAGQPTTAVSWVEPVGYDIEDGVIPHVVRIGSGPGSRFSGHNILHYRVSDSQGGSYSCSSYITVRLVECPPIHPQTHQTSTCQGPSYYGDNCTFSCDAGYYLVGPTTLTCTVDGEYDSEPPICAEPCPQPALPTNAVRWECTDSYRPNSVCSVKCTSGFRAGRTYNGSLWNEGHIQCGADGSWTGEAECTADMDATMTIITNLMQEMRGLKTVQRNLEKFLAAQLGYVSGHDEETESSTAAPVH